MTPNVNQIYHSPNPTLTTPVKMDRHSKRLMYLTIFIACVLLILTGCATTERVVTKTEVKYITVPEEMLKECEVTRPPAVANYVSKTAREKEEILTTYASQLLKDLSNCSDNLDAIRKYQARQLQILKDAEKKETDK